MKNANPESWIDLRRLPPGRVVLALRKMRKRATARGLGALVAEIDALLPVYEALVSAYRVFRAGQAQPEAEWTPQILALDLALDRDIVTLRDLLVALARGRDARAEAARRLVARHFQKDITYFTNQAVDVETVVVADLLGALAADAADIELASVGANVAAVRDSWTPFDQAIDAFEAAPRASYASLFAEHTAAHRGLCRLVAGLVREPDDAARAELLAPVAHHDAEVAEQLRRKKAVVDIDPNTAPEAGED